MASVVEPRRLCCKGCGYDRSGDPSGANGVERPNCPECGNSGLPEELLPEMGWGRKCALFVAPTAVVTTAMMVSAVVFFPMAVVFLFFLFGVVVFGPIVTAEMVVAGRVYEARKDRAWGMHVPLAYAGAVVGVVGPIWIMMLTNMLVQGRAG